MTTYPMHYTDNADSWRRLGMLWRLYWPGLRQGFIIAATVPLVIVFFAAFVGHISGYKIDWLMEWPITMILYLSPVMLTKRDYRDISSQLPVTAREKLGFLLLTFWIAVPAIVLISSYAGECLITVAFGSEITELLHGNMRESLEVAVQYTGTDPYIVNTIGQVISVMSMVAIVLYYMIKSKRNRALTAILTMFITLLLLGLVSGIIGGIIGAVAGYQGMANGASEEYISACIVKSTIWIITISYIALEIIAIIILIKLYRRLRNCGF